MVSPLASPARLLEPQQDAALHPQAEKLHRFEQPARGQKLVLPGLPPEWEHPPDSLLRLYPRWERLLDCRSHELCRLPRRHPLD